MCNHKKVTRLAWVSRAPLKTGYHTAFDLLKCGECGAVFGFPQENLDLALEQGTPETLKGLAERGVKVG